MREMKNSGVEWIGEIPADWRVIKNKYLLKFMYSGGTPSSTNSEFYCDNGIPFVSISDMSNTAFVNKTKKHITYEGLLDKNLKVLKKGTILYSIYATIGAVSELKVDAAISQAMLALSTNEDVERRYYKYNLEAMKDYVYFNANGNTQFNLNAEKVNNFFFVLPSLTEQHRIADFLDEKCAKIDAVIEKQKQVIEKLKEYKLSVITEAVTKGLDPTVPMKDSGVEYAKIMPAHWENRKMISILSMRVVDGPHESPELFDEGIPYISATAIENGKIDFEKMRGYISEEYCDECDKRYKPQINDILIVKLGASTGQVAIVETDRRFNIWVPLAVVRCNDFALPKFVYYAFQSDYFIKQMEQSWTYGTQQTLGVKTIERLRILIPNIEEQKVIVAFLEEKCSQFDSAISKKQAIVEKLTEYKKSLIYEVVTGKREV